MTPDAVIEHLNVLKHNLPRMVTGFKFEVMQAFSFKRAEETFHRCVVPRGQAARSQQSPLRLMDVFIL